MDQDVPTPSPVPPISLNISPEGMTISIAIAPGVAITQTLPENVMNAICKQWVETRREVQKHLEIAQNVVRASSNEVQRDLKRIQNAKRRLD